MSVLHAAILLVRMVWSCTVYSLQQLSPTLNYTCTVWLGVRCCSTVFKSRCDCTALNQSYILESFWDCIALNPPLFWNGCGRTASNQLSTLEWL
jgi:hypothetical protein